MTAEHASGTPATTLVPKHGVAFRERQDLPAAVVASADEALKFIESRALHGKGVGYVDIHLLASVALTPGARLWTRDLKLRRVADFLGCAQLEDVERALGL
jgi:hypothetical protein